MKLQITPGTARGQVVVPPSKSVAHRYLIAAAMADGVSRVRHLPHSEDILATVDCLNAMGATLVWEGDDVIVTGSICDKTPKAPLLCRECGTTLRLLLPLCLLGNGRATLSGTEKLLSRPLGAYEDICREQGFYWDKHADHVTVEGTLAAGRYELPGDVSSQYISGLLYALTAIAGESEIVLTTKVESRPYIDLTLDALRLFGASLAWVDDTTLRVVGSRLHSADVTVEGDWSSAATWVAMQALGDPIEVGGVLSDSHQGDRVIADYMKQIAAGCPTLSVADCPDLAPTLMAAAALANGVHLTDTARLALKESDRAHAMQSELAKCGVTVTVDKNDIYVPGGQAKAPVVPLASHQDHRIVMAGALLCTRLGGEIEGCRAVGKSYPDFFEALSALGIEVIHV